MTERIVSNLARDATAAEAAGDADLTGKTVIVTGGTSGIGIETAKALAANGASVVVTARNMAAARQALEATDATRLSLAELDLASLASVRRFTDQWGDRRLDILINNAGVMHVPFGNTEEGFEHHIGVNHLAHFLLALRLVPALRKGENARVIAVSSAAHRLSPWDWTDPHFARKPYDPNAAYGQSKAANALFALAFEARYGDEGIHSFSLMPGVIHTGLMRHMNDVDVTNIKTRLAHAVKTPAQGAATSVWAAIAPELAGHGGLYLEDCAEAVPSDPAVPGVGVASHVRNPGTAERLWQWSLAAVGESASAH